MEVHENILRSSKKSCPHKCEKLGPSECQEHNSLDQTEIKCVCQAMRVCMALRPKSKLPLMDWGNQDHHVLLALDGASLGVWIQFPTWLNLMQLYLTPSQQKLSKSLDWAHVLKNPRSGPRKISLETTMACGEYISITFEAPEFHRERNMQISRYGQVIVWTGWWWRTTMSNCRWA